MKLTTLLTSAALALGLATSGIAGEKTKVGFIYVGPVGDGAHADHEFLYIDKTIERTALLALLLLSPPLETNGKQKK